MSINKEKLLNAIINASGKKINKNAVEKAKSGDLSAVLAGLDPKSRQSLMEALNNKEKAQRILASDEARQLLKNLSGGNKNG